MNMLVGLIHGFDNSSGNESEPKYTVAQPRQHRGDHGVFKQSGAARDVAEDGPVEYCAVGDGLGTGDNLLHHARTF